MVDESMFATIVHDCSPECKKSHVTVYLELVQEMFLGPEDELNGDSSN